MTLGTRVTLVTTTVIASVLAVSGYAALKVRRANLEADLGREALEIAAALRAGIEPCREGAALSDDAAPAHPRRARAGRTVPAGGAERRHRREDRRQGVAAADAGRRHPGPPVGRLFDSASGPRWYAMAVPLYDAAGLELPRGHPARNPVAVLGMRRDSRLHRRRGRGHRAPRRPAVLAGGGRRRAGGPVRARRTVVRPLRRLVEGIDGVARAICRGSSSPSATTRSVRSPGGSTP